MRITVKCTWPGCRRFVELPAKTFRCKVHQRMAAILEKNAARKAEERKP